MAQGYGVNGGANFDEAEDYGVSTVMTDAQGYSTPASNVYVPVEEPEEYYPAQAQAPTDEEYEAAYTQAMASAAAQIEREDRERYDELGQKKGWSEEEYLLDDIPPMSIVQKAVIVCALVGVFFVIVFCLNFYGVINLF